MTSDPVDIAIIGAGPTGLAAARELQRRGLDDWVLIERSPDAGGLAGSVLDDAGYTWDLGGHIQFSHYDEFDDVMDELLAPDEWLHHERESWVWLRDRFVPYPFQNNLRYLPRDEMWACVKGLTDLWKRRAETDGHAPTPDNFHEWTLQTFGEGICDVFMHPYNFKVWAWDLREMAWGWIGDRVAVADLERVLGNILLERDDVSWGPNNRFRFPLRGGTGEIWRRLAASLPSERLRLNSEIERIDTAARRLYLRGQSDPIPYRRLLSTMPLDRLVALSDLADDREMAEAAALLRHSSTHIVGLGIDGAPPPDVATKCWMYFPQDDSPFYRATVFSNYSPNNVPDIDRGWSLMCEVSESPQKPVDATRVVAETVRGALASRLVDSESLIAHTWHRRLDYGYPTPSLHRDRALQTLLPRLADLDVYSRGRFGAWKYEVSNQDHSFMQGVECIRHLLEGAPEETLQRPEVVNARRSSRLAKL